jgi:hypothetical protein
MVMMAIEQCREDGSCDVLFLVSFFFSFLLFFDDCYRFGSLHLKRKTKNDNTLAGGSLNFKKFPNIVIVVDRLAVYDYCLIIPCRETF